MIKNKLINHNFPIIFLLLLCLSCVVLHSSFGRPLWIDEFLHFAFGSYKTTPEAWGMISQSILGVNHGQTGIYMLINYWLMQLFGANTFWLRFPSIISGLFLFLATLYLFRLWGLPFLWQVMGILALASQTQLMYFVGEARPYMPLVTAAVCTLGYYSTPLSQRSRPIFTLFGLFSILMGVLFHPYFSVYWLAIIVFTYCQKLIEAGEKFSVYSVLEHVNIPLSVMGTIVYFYLGSLTWLRGRPDFEFTLDPFQFVKKDQLIIPFIKWGHFEFLQKLLYPFFLYPFLIVTILILIVIFSKNHQRVYLKNIISPVLLIIMALSISIFLSYISFRSNYWILTRQWVASIALVSLGFIWFAYKVSKLLWKNHVILAFLWMILCFAPIGIKFTEVAKTNSQLMGERLAKTATLSPESQDSFKDLESIEYFDKPETLKSWLSKINAANNSGKPTSDYWVSLANKNIQQGGKVWKGFRSFYDDSK
ncbi:MAG: hypothetical protein VKJ02_15975 [Snowella sp.]|nr:hypothetical protein [Snowella sp.]